SAFLHPFAPPALPGFNATMDALTPAPSGLGGHRPIGPTGAKQVSLFHVPYLPTLPPPTTLRRPVCMVWFHHTGLPEDVPQPECLSLFMASVRHLGFALATQAHHDDRPNRVRYPTDGSFTSCCSPPRLLTTQLHSVTRFRPNLDEDLHLADT